MIQIAVLMKFIWIRFEKGDANERSNALGA